MEQLVARRAHNPKVVGSSPAPATQSSLRKPLVERSEAFFALLLVSDKIKQISPIIRLFDLVKFIHLSK
jgi:hypothetical protein